MTVQASELLTAAQRAEVEAAIAEAETHTTGEIVVVVATRSGRYERGEDLVGICAGLLTLTAGWLVWQGVTPVSEAWDSGWKPTLGLAAVLALFLVGFWVGSALAARFPILARMFIPSRLMVARLEAKAAEAFHRFRVRRTADATGVLIYLSLFERMLWVVGDDQVSSKVDDSVWEAIRDTVVKSMRAGLPAEGLTAAVRRSGDVLAEVLPADGDNPNELRNGLVLVDAE